MHYIKSNRCSIYSLTPIFILWIFSVLTWCNVRNNLRRHRGLEQLLTRILFAQMVMVLLTSIPNFVNQMYFFYTRTISKNSLQLAQESVASSVFTLFGLVHTVFRFTCICLHRKHFGKIFNLYLFIFLNFRI
jgi:hypothetical protein